jgi:hypothetical protein
LVRLRRGAKPYFHELSPRHWTVHVERLLSNDVRGLQVKDAAGHVLARVSWHAFLRYDQEMRNWMTKELNAGRQTLATGLQAARDNAELRTLYLVTPIATSHLGAVPPRAPMGPSSSGENEFVEPAAKRPRRRAPAGKAEGGKGKQGKPKGKGGAKGGGNDYQQGGGWKLNICRRLNQVKKLPDNKSICWAFNKTGCAAHECPHAHVCAYCGGNHGIETCNAFRSYQDRR